VYTSSAHLGPVGHPAIARARGVRLDGVASLDDALRSAVDSDEPALLDVPTDPGAHPPVSLFADALDRRRADEIVREPVA
jgi:acetolactate synthase I/II/III large subunit